MKPPSPPSAIRQIVEHLARLLDVPGTAALLQPEPDGIGVDAVAHVGPHTFAIEWKGSGSAAAVAMAAARVRREVTGRGKTILPMVAVPYMGPVGQQQCEEARVGWMDLSGNARIVAEGLRILIQGCPNRFKAAGRPSSVFAPKSARIARWLLMHPDRTMTQRELSRATGMGEGFTSRIVARLDEDGLLTRPSRGTIRLRDFNLLLDAWGEAYDFSRHRIVRGHVRASSGDRLLHHLAEELTRHGHEHAATGLGAAWLWVHFAGFRIVTLYLKEEPTPEVLEALSFREEPRGANVWLVIPNDEGVFHGSAERDGVSCVHPVQAYLDLKAHPERAQEAAQVLRAEMPPRRHDA